MDIFTLAAIAGILGFFVPASYKSYKYIKKSFTNSIDKFKASIIKELEQPQKQFLTETLEELKQSETSSKLEKYEEQFAQFQTDINKLKEQKIYIKSNKKSIKNIKGVNSVVTEKTPFYDQNAKLKETTTKEIYYDEENRNFCFKSNPTIVLGISNLNIDQNVFNIAMFRIKAEIAFVNTNFFKVKVSNWEKSYVHEVEINWIAYGN